MKRLLVLLAALPLGCARSTSPAADDLRPDLRRDLATSDRERSDALAPDRASPDLPRKLSCAAPELVGTGYTPASPGGLAEVAISSDGLRLYAWCAGGRCRAARAAIGEAFGDWGPAPELPFGNDPAFFGYLGENHVIVARSPNGDARRLELCSWPGLGCAPLPVRDAAGPISFDMDGPSVAVVGARVLLAHNIGVGGSATADLFLAEPVDPSDLSVGFQTIALAAINQPSAKEDDPALSPDGLLLVFSTLHAGNGEDLWVSQRASLADPFPAPERLASLSSKGEDKGPCFAPAGAGGPGYELFFESTRSGKTQLYRSACVR